MKRSPPDPDRHDLVRRARDAQADLARDDADFNRLVTAWRDFAVSTAFGHLHDAGLAEDAAQESFVIVWRRLHTLKDLRAFVPWLRRIIASQCHRVLRKKSSRFSQLDDSVASEHQVEEAVNRRERARFVRDALAHLSPAEREVLLLARLPRYSNPTIGKLLGIPATTVAKRLASAKRRLRAALAPLDCKIPMARASDRGQFAAMVRAGIYRDYVGLYRFDLRPELTVKVERVGNRLVSYSAGQKNTVLLGCRLSELRTREFDGRAQFVRDRSGQITHFVYYEFGRRMGIARKVSP